MISLKKICLGLLLGCAISLNGYAQDSTNTDDLTFTEIKPETADSTVKAVDSNLKTTVSTPATVQKTIAPQKEEHKTLWGIFIAGFVGGLAALLMPCI